jgi:hypothetical protein
LAGLGGLDDQVSWRIRERLQHTHPGRVAASLLEISNRDPRAAELRTALIKHAPLEVLSSLQGQNDDWCWSERLRLFGAEPHAVMRSLRGLWHEDAWALRERWMNSYAERLGSDYELARSAAASINGSGDERAWSFRNAAWSSAPVAALNSLTALTCERSWQRRERSLLRAPKIVMATLRTLRRRLGFHCGQEPRVRG